MYVTISRSVGQRDAAFDVLEAINLSHGRFGVALRVILGQLHIALRVTSVVKPPVRNRRGDNGKCEGSRISLDNLGGQEATKGQEDQEVFERNSALKHPKKEMRELLSRAFETTKVALDMDCFRGCLHREFNASSEPPHDMVPLFNVNLVEEE